MVKITVVQCTKRKEPRFDWALESLKNQTFKDFEYIIVDGRFKERSDAVKEFLKQRAPLPFHVLYIRDKPSRWKNIRPALCNARNTALIFAKGQYIVHHDDNCKMPPDWLEKHLKWLEQGYIVAGSWVSYRKEGVVGDGKESRYQMVKQPKLVGGGWLYGTNFSYPLSVALGINGFDEELDGEMGQDDLNFGVRAERKGYCIMYDPTCEVQCIYETHDSVSDKRPKDIVLRDGKPHFSNEFHTQKLLDDRNRYLPYANNFTLSELRSKLNNIDTEAAFKELEKYIDPNLFDWRDNENISRINH